MNEGAIFLSEWNGPREEGGYYWQTLEAAAREFHINLDAPVRSLSKEKLDIVLYGTHGKEVTIHYHNKDGRQATFRTPFEGVINNLHRRYTETTSEYIKERISEVLSEVDLPSLQRSTAA